MARALLQQAQMMELDHHLRLIPQAVAQVQRLLVQVFASSYWY